MYRDEKYVNGAFHMPDFENTPWKEKMLKPFCISVGVWLYHLHLNDKTAIPASLEQLFQLARLYGEGKQPKEIYEKNPQKNSPTAGTDIFDREVRRKGLANQNDRIVSLMPKIKSIIIPMLKNIDFDVRCDAVDPVSGSEEEDKMMRVWMRSHLGGVLDDIALRAGLPITNDEIFPEDSNDLKQLRMEGMFKPEHTIEVEEIIKHILNISKWDEDLSEKYSNEALDTGYICGYCDYDHEDKSEKVHFSYPEDTIKQYSKSRTYSDSDLEGVMVDYPVSTLRLIFPEVPLKDWMGMAKKYQGYKGNPHITDFNRWGDSYTGNGSPWDEFNIPVLYYNWTDVEKQEKVRYTTKKGKTVISDKDRAIEALHTKDNLFTHRRRVKMGCKWIVGTDLAWDYGPYPNQPHKMTRPLSSVFVYRFPYEALTIRCMPLMDDLQFAWKKYNDAMAKAFPGAVAIDISMLNNISDNKNPGRKLDWTENIKNMYNMGVLAFMPNPVNVHVTASGGGIPIHEIPSTVLKSLSEYLSVINQIVLLFETFTGFSPVFLGGTPTDKQAVKNTQLSYSSTLKSLQHIVDGKGLFKQAAAEYCAERMRIILAMDEDARKTYESVIGVEGVALVLMAKKRGAEYGTKMVARPSDEDRQAVIQQAIESHVRYQNGGAGLNSGQKTKIIFMVNSGANLGNVSRFMDMWERKSQKELEASQMRTIQANSLEVQKQDQTRGAIKEAEDKRSYQDKVNFDKIETDNNIREIMVEKEWDRRIKQAERNAEYKQSLKEQIDAGAGSKV